MKKSVKKTTKKKGTVFLLYCPVQNDEGDDSDVYVYVIYDSEQSGYDHEEKDYGYDYLSDHISSSGILGPNQHVDDVIEIDHTFLLSEKEIPIGAIVLDLRGENFPTDITNIKNIHFNKKE